jgi:hypothetical protein
MSDSSQRTDDGGWAHWQALTAQAYERYQAQLLAIRADYPGLTNYDASDRVQATAGTMPWRWGGDSEVRETINSINGWGARLHSWHAWNNVVASYEEETDRWEVVHSFVEPIGFFCMLQPSGLADRLALTAETLLHQANLVVIDGYSDSLMQDKSPDRPLRRSDRRKQLNRLGSTWTNYPAFRDAFNTIDGSDYQTLTGNFRDLAAHAFAPRFMIGQIPRAWRKKVDLEELVAKSDDTVEMVTDPTRKMIQYAMGALEPLPLEKAYAANLAEYARAKSAIAAFGALIDEMCNRIDAKP